MMSQTEVTVDIAIIGGGIAGLWLLNRLCNQGYNAILFENEALGNAQTIASQGMIHGGIKYALGGALTGASEAIADMPEHWRRCLEGCGDVDLRNAKVLSDHFYMWSTKSITSRITSFFASKVTRGRVDSISNDQRPAVFNTGQFKGSLYKLVDLVLDVPTVIGALRDNYRDRIFTIDWEYSQLVKSEHQTLSHLSINTPNNNGRCFKVNAEQFVFTAGAGNESLMNQLDIKSPAMQRRPLRQVLVKHHYDYPLYAHCMGNNPSPRLTVSSHLTSDKQYVWYLGGDLATEGAHLDDNQLIQNAKHEMNELFPWLDFSKSQWATLYVDRAEPKQKGLIKPDKAFAEFTKECKNVIVAWPTKLTLSPALADDVYELLSQHNISPGNNNSSFQSLEILGTPPIATPCWEIAFQTDNS